MVGAYLALRFDRATCLGDPFGGVRQSEKFSTVRGRVGQSQNTVCGPVTGRGVVEVAAGGPEVEGKPAGEVAQPGNVPAEFVLVGWGERIKVDRELLGVAETALAHAKVRGPQPGGEPGRPVGVLPDVGEDVERRLGVPGYPLPVTGRHRQARGDGGVHRGARCGQAARERGDRCGVPKPDSGLRAQAPQRPGRVTGPVAWLAGQPLSRSSAIPAAARALPGGPPGRRSGAGQRLDLPARRPW